MDAISKTPECKLCAVRLEPISDQLGAETLLQQNYATLQGDLAREGGKPPVKALESA